MSFPNFRNKHKYSPIIRPDHEGLGRKQFQGILPSDCIITYQDDAFRYLKRKYTGKYVEMEVPFSWGFKGVCYTKNFVFCMIGGIGAPHATLMFEELIALGLDRFVSVGIAGGLVNYGVYLCNRSVRDEGTSHHYASHEMYASPHRGLTNKLAQAMKRKGLDFKKADNWTTDAPLRETREEVKWYRSKGVATVEMELSALFVVARLRKVQIAAALVVSDVLNDNWVDMNRSVMVRRSLEKVSECAVECLK